MDKDKEKELEQFIQALTMPNVPLHVAIEHFHAELTKAGRGCQLVISTGGKELVVSLPESE